MKTLIVPGWKHSGKWLFAPEFEKLQNASVAPNGNEIEPFGIDSEVRTAMCKELDLEGKLVLGDVGRFTEANLVLRDMQ